MCGISGIYLYKESFVSKEIISNFNNAVSHRGPDAESYFFNENFAFGHRRLSIIDLSEKSDQPMTKFGLTIVYNGEIFNYLEIKVELSEMGHVFETESDTEVILASYKEWGNDCVNRFNGMWAFCIFDNEKQLFFCSRDRFGIKPFFYINNSQFFAFGSEIKQILTLLDEKIANKRVLAEFIIGNEDFHEETFFKDVFRILPGHNMVFCLNKNKIKTWKYYEINLKMVPAKFEDCLKEFSSLFEDSVELRLRSDVKVGTCLSGGLDSSAIASIAAIKYNDKNLDQFIGIHAKSIEKATDESYFAQTVAVNSKINLFCIAPDSNSFRQALDKVIQIQDEPFGGPSIVMQYFVFGEAAKRKIKVMLDGQGGDEILLGYDSYFNMYLSNIPILKNILRIIKLSKENLFRVNLRFVYFFRPLIALIKRRLHKNKFSFLNSKYFNLIDYKLIIDEALKHCGNDFQFQKFEMEHGIQKLLRFEDRNSMFHGIESRLPFLDHRLVEFSLSLKLTNKLNKNETKYILRKMLNGKLPDEVIYRKDKKGFEAPSIFWIQYIEESKEIIKESKLLKDMLVEGNFPKDKSIAWRLSNIARWEKEYNVVI
jgi:asparagine synthase (glutamine-hydrolysing)